MSLIMVAFHGSLKLRALYCTLRDPRTLCDPFEVLISQRISFEFTCKIPALKDAKSSLQLKNMID